MDLLRTINGVCVGKTNTGLIHGDVAYRTLELEDIEVHWSGSKIPDDLVLKFLAFSIDVYEKHGGEVQGRLYYDAQRGDWQVVIQKQLISHSLHSEEIGGDGDIEESILQLPDGNYIYMGTCHSHCSAPPGPSITDKKNEIKQNGIHFTVGCIDEEKYLINVRASFRGINYNMSKLGSDGDVLNDSLSMNSSDRGDYPDSWWDHLIAPPPKRKQVSLRNSNNSKKQFYTPHYTRPLFDQNKLDEIVCLIGDLLPEHDVGLVCREIERQQIQLEFIEQYNDDRWQSEFELKDTSYCNF